MIRYKVIGRVGQGAHGYVMKGIDRVNNEIVALKKLLIKNLDEGIPKKIMREICTLRVLKSEYIVELLDVLPYGMGIVLVMEYLPCCLYDVIKDTENPINDAQTKSYMNMMLCGIKYMHNNHIMHRDLKPANLLISKKGMLKIADFGLARIYVDNDPERQYSHQVMTRWYRSPELLYGARNYSTAIDMWSVGCIFAELINKTPLFPGETDIEQLAIVLHTLGTPSEESWPGLTNLPDYNKITFGLSQGVKLDTLVATESLEALDLLNEFIQYNYLKRPTAEEALLHPYFKTHPHACPLTDMPKPEVIKSLKEISYDKFDEMFHEIM